MRRYKGESGLQVITLCSVALAVAFTILLPREVHASLVELTARPATASVVYWNQIGAFGFFTSPQSFTSTGGITGNVNMNGTGDLVEQCCIGISGNFDGDFSPGDAVIVTYLAPLTINFNTPVQSVGTQIQDDRIGDLFTAEIQAFHSGLLLGTFTENGFSGDVGDNSDIFLGVRDTTADITSVVYLTYTSTPQFQLQSVAINQLTVGTTAIPGALPLFATGIGALGLLGARRKRKAQADCR
jgi:hypothetical protein